MLVLILVRVRLSQVLLYWTLAITRTALIFLLAPLLFHFLKMGSRSIPLMVILTPVPGVSRPILGARQCCQRLSITQDICGACRRLLTPHNRPPNSSHEVLATCEGGTTTTTTTTTTYTLANMTRRQAPAPPQHYHSRRKNKDDHQLRVAILRD